jgi:NAD(P)-dependent dehydrogenase (short-subunit alcohol dehydrogenase family)
MTTPSILQDKVAFITGSGTGIGRATALCLSRAGAKVVIAELNPTTGSETATSIASQTGNEVLSVQCDVSQSASIEAAVRATVDAFGSLDIAVNNAGLHPDSMPIESLDEAYWNALISVNLTGVALSMKWELRQMVAQGRGGSIVNMASGTIFRAQKGMAAYVATKHGVIGLTQVAALENGKHGIRVNALAPGGVATELSKAALEKMGSSEEAAAEGNSLFKRFARPEEIGRAILWMVSDGSAYMTGTTIPLDAGMSIM